MLPRFGDEVIATLRELYSLKYLSKEQLIEAITHALRFGRKNLTTEVVSQWEKLKDDVTGNDFASLLQRYVGTSIIEDEFDDENKRSNKLEILITNLAQQAVSNFALLELELKWLLTDKAKRGAAFGYQLGQFDQNSYLLPELLEHQEIIDDVGGAILIGGYLRFVFEKDPNQWELILAQLAVKDKFNKILVELTARSGMSGLAAERLIQLANSGKVELIDFMNLRYSKIEVVPENTFIDLLNLLLNSNDSRIHSIAMLLFSFYYESRDKAELSKKLPDEVTYKLLTHPVLFKKTSYNNFDHYLWMQISAKYIEQYLEKSIGFGNIILEHFGEEGTIVGGFLNDTHAILGTLLEKFPQEIWRLITKFLGPPIDGKAYRLREWLKGDDFFSENQRGPINLIPKQLLWDWIDEDVNVRAWYAAGFVPKAFTGGDDSSTLFRDILIRYGNREDVRNNLSANFMTGGWTGPGSLYHLGQKQRIEKFGKSENNTNIMKWVSEMVEGLDEQIEKEKMWEERDE